MKLQTPSANPIIKWLPGTLALATSSGISQAATVQITFANNIVSNSTGLTQFNPDIGGDGIADVTAGFTTESARVDIGYVFSNTGSFARAILYSGSFYATIGGNFDSGGTSAALTGKMLFSTNVPGLGARDGHLQFTVLANSSGQSVRINRFVFDDASSAAPSYSAGTTYPEYSAVPEASTGLLGLAAGAAGLMRRRRAAATR